MLFKIFWGIIGTVGAYLLIRYRFQIQETFGTFTWAERYLGSTEFAIVSFAIFLFIWSILYMTGTFEGFIVNTFGRIF